MQNFGKLGGVKNERTFRQSLVNELQDLEWTVQAIYRNPVFINEEIKELTNKIEQLNIILSVLED